MTARRHHFISQCYLRGFAADSASPRLFVTDFQERRTFWTSPENVALERDFHTVEAPGHPPDVVEKALAKFEGDLAPALRRICDNASLAEDEDRGLLLYFMTLLTVKTTETRGRASSWLNQIMSTVMKRNASNDQIWAAETERARAEGTIEHDADIDAMRKGILNDELEVGLTVPAALDIEFDNALRLLPLFHERRWYVLRASQDRTAFVTSDHPVCLGWADPQRRGPVGLAVRETQVLFPVSNSVAIIGTFEGVDRTVEATDEMIGVFNAHILLHVNRQVFARGDDFVYDLPHNGRPVQGVDLLADPISTRGDSGPEPVSDA